MLVLGVPHNAVSFVTDEEVGKKTAATTRTTEFSETGPRYDTVIQRGNCLQDLATCLLYFTALGFDTNSNNEGFYY